MPATTEGADLDRLRATLDQHGQSHVLAFVDRLDAPQQQRLLAQIKSIDLTALDGLINRYVRQRERFELPANLEPAAYYPYDASDSERPYDAAKYRAHGEELIRAGKV